MKAVRVGNYLAVKTEAGYTLMDKSGAVVGVFPTARKATDHAFDLTAAAYKARVAL